VTLNDANQKKCAFLRQATIELALRNVEVQEGRVEAWLPARRFEVVISRAFAELASFVSACRHLVARGGALAAMKGTYPGDELGRLPACCRCDEAFPLRVPLLDAERHLVLCRVENQA
jgi:16S rRNA (guanine527-N7)-methyltransferase